MQFTGTSKIVSIGGSGVRNVNIGTGQTLVFIGGPCAIESLDHTLFMAEAIDKICGRLTIPWVFKSCYDKDCRSSVDSYHGVGIEEGLTILSKVRAEFGTPVTSDFSDPAWGPATGEVVDLVQVPAYLCRQTSILRAAALTAKPVHLKKGQFMSPWNMKNSVKKLNSFGCDQVLLTERGTFFGYGMLVNDMTSLPIMAKTGYPVCFDATHSIQMPTSLGSVSGGQREFIPALVRSSIAAGADAIFMEVHDNPKAALSDPNTQLNLTYLENVLAQAKYMHDAVTELQKTIGVENVQ